MAPVPDPGPSPQTRASPPIFRSDSSNSQLTGNRRSRPTSISMPPPVLPASAQQSDSDPPIPQRHPHQLTPAELHEEVEKEQECLVNRLSRDLASLRAHSASVASNASSSSAASAAAPAAVGTDNAAASASRPTPSRRHRSSSSSLSTRSVTSSIISSSAPSAAPVGGTSQASVDRVRDAQGVNAPGRLSRQNSIGIPSSARSSTAASPSLPHASLDFGGAGGLTPGSTMQSRGSVGSVGSSTGRLEESIRAREALEGAKKENEMLIRRIRELEGEVRELRRTGS